MGRINTSSIVTEVKIILDENDSSDALVLDGDIDQLKTDELIEHLIPTAIDRISSLAPVSMIMDMAVDMDDSEVSWDLDDEYCQKRNAPEDMIRLVYVRLGGWSSGVTDFISDTDLKYREYRSEFSGIRPDRMYPGVALSQGPGSSIVIECYPKTGSEFNIVKYLPVTTESTGDDSGYSVSDQAFRPLLYMIANLYYVSLGDADRAAMMAAKVQEMIGLKNTNTAEEG